MLAVLVVGPDAPDAAELSALIPSVEILRAHGTEEALEKLGRNRRIDAILLTGTPAQNRETLGAIREDNPAPPPVFAAADGPPDSLPGVRGLPPGPAAGLLARLVEELGR
jgi:hypothetical protein